MIVAMDIDALLLYALLMLCLLVLFNGIDRCVVELNVDFLVFDT